MILTDKLKDNLWIFGFPIILYLGASGMDSLDDKIPYLDSLRTPITTTKLIAGVIHGFFYIESLYHNSKENNKK